MPPVTLAPLETVTSPPEKTLNEACNSLSGDKSPATDSPPAPVTLTLLPDWALKTLAPEIARVSALNVPPNSPPVPPVKAALPATFTVAGSPWVS